MSTVLRSFKQLNLINKVVMALILSGGITLLSGQAHASTLDSAYLSNFSVEQGGSIDLYASVPDTSFSLYTYNYNPKLLSFHSVGTGLGGVQAVPTDASLFGAGWNLSATINIPKSWPSGLYQVNLRSTNYKKNEDTGDALLFTVKASNPGRTSKILVLDSAPTNVAYNNWGGKSLYQFNSSPRGAKANRVSLLRPGQNYIQREEYEFSLWAKKKGIALEFASMMDLQIDSSLLFHYNMVVVVGHNEYWTKEMRDNFDAFVKGGGNAMILAGNTMWWQARVEGDQMVCYKKNAANDPMNGIDPLRVTTNWFANPVKNPENRSIGVSFRNGGYVNAKGHYMAAPGSNNGGFTVTDASNSLFAGTGLKNGDVFGVSSKIVGYETDGALYSLKNGKPVVTGADGTPTNFQILGVADAYIGHIGHATMGIFQPFAQGGYVFNASTVNWTEGLWYRGDATRPRGTEDPIVSQITMNVINQFDEEGFEAQRHEK